MASPVTRSCYINQGKAEQIIYYSSSWLVERFRDGRRASLGLCGTEGRGSSCYTANKKLPTKGVRDQKKLPFRPQSPLRIHYLQFFYINCDGLMTWATCWLDLLTLWRTAQQIYRTSNNNGHVGIHPPMQLCRDVPRVGWTMYFNGPLHCVLMFFLAVLVGLLLIISLFLQVTN